MASLANKVFAITGGASGMGLATARRLAGLKARGIAIGDFNTKNFEQVRKDLLKINPEMKVLTSKLDVSSSSSVSSWITEILDTFGALDGAVNAAGVPQTVGARKAPTILEENDETWERTIGINLNGVFFSTRAQIKAMVSLPKAPRSIVNISSMASLVHGADVYAYGVSKVAVASFTTSVSKDVLSFGIRVNTVSPGELFWNLINFTSNFYFPRELVAHFPIDDSLRENKINCC
jgi:chanoclavine-I dehydrogenase